MSMRPAAAARDGATSVRMYSSADMAASASVVDAVDALGAALRLGLDPESDAPRSRVRTETGDLLVMPSAMAEASGVKLLTLTHDNPARGLPVIQGVYVLFEGADQSPVALLDGIALTNLRTSAVSALAVRHLTPEGAAPASLTIFGTGPQARAHLGAMAAVRQLARVTVVGRDPEALEWFVREGEVRELPLDTKLAGEGDPVAEADLICCCTNAREPLFDGAAVRDDAVVVAMGAHTPDAREVDSRLVTRSTVVVESRSSALREAGDVVLAIAEGAMSEEALMTLRELVTAPAELPRRPRLFKSTGMPWEDLVVANQIHRGGHR
ncbi:ornithine cyclodeaminase family protein [Georgenia ruanii]